MLTKNLRNLTFVALGVMCAAPQAFAWDPNAGAEPVSAYISNGQAAALPTYAVPNRYYSNPYAPRPATPAPTTYYAPPRYAQPPAPTAPASYATYQPVTNAVQPTPTIAPVTQPYPPAPYQPYQPATVAAAPVPAQVAVAPVSEAQISPMMTMGRTQNARTNQFSVGLEAFYDIYKEEQVKLEDKAYYGAFDAGFTHYFDPNVFGLFEGRVSYGSNDYKSISGKASDIPQWELEGRANVGYDFTVGQSGRLKPYFGMGGRYYVDEGKGVRTVDALGNVYGGYDRRIFQLYVPIGLTYEFQAAGLTFAPNLEYDQILYGRVASRLQTLPGYTEAVNEQQPDQGYGLRAEFAVSQLDERGRGWQVSPFVRYWHFTNSDEDIANTPSGPSYFIEPHNSRTQMGVKLKYLF